MLKIGCLSDSLKISIFKKGSKNKKRPLFGFRFVFLIISKGYMDILLCFRFRGCSFFK